MITDFRETVTNLDSEILNFDGLETLQLNLGDICNQSCEHCHIDASPAGNKIMSREVMEKIVDFLQNHRGLTLDITGGCPELNPNFRFFIEEAHGLASRLMIRTNLTVLLENGMDWIPQWYRDHQVVVMASLPCYTKENTDRQRGNGVFEKSVEALKRLCELGYGSSLELNLVYNPGDDFLPGSQRELEVDYREQLLTGYGVRFSNLFTIANAPLGRFKNYLTANGLTEQYIRLLMDSFNPDTVRNIMCRNLISVDWQGVLYNCDFNLAAGLSIRNWSERILKIDDIQDAIQNGHEIVTAEHCYCCTAGAGSSCTGALI